MEWGDYREAGKVGNLLERDYQLKRMMGFGEATFTRLDGLLRGGAL